ncbi:pyruvate kinase-like protein [Xylariaceae sp. FL1272]|nr:pyruvate kinase-like protein [Xylariaceae sp. FL1272]
MEVLAISAGQPKFQDVNGAKLYTSIVHEDVRTLPSEYMEVDEFGIVGNTVAVHDGPVYVLFEDHYDYWCKELGIDRSSWNWGHWGENLTVRFKDTVKLEDQIHIGDIWKIGKTVRLQVCGVRVPCMKLSWRCGQKDSWLQTAFNTGRSGVYLRVLSGGKVHPGDDVSYEVSTDDPLNVAAIVKIAFDMSLKTRDTMNLIMNHPLMMRMNKWHFGRMLTTMEDKEQEGKNAWKGFRDLRVRDVVDEEGGVKSFYMSANDGQVLANYFPGQFLTIRLPNGVTRNWTISDYHTRDGPEYYRVSIKKVGPGSTWMHENCAPGSVLSARSPAGHFFLDRTSKLRVVYISAGIGITPILAMMKGHADHPNMKFQPVVWIHIARDGANFPFQDEIPSFEKSVAFSRSVFFTNPRPADVKGVHYDCEGRPDKATLEEILGASFTWSPLGAGKMVSEAKFSTVYMCGPSKFETEIRETLKKLGYLEPLIRSESFHTSAAALGHVKRATVRFSKSKVTGTWTKEEPMSLLELAESLGLAPDFGCRIGACGSCATKLTCGSVSSGMQADGTVLTCSAAPASEEVELEL